MAKPRSKRPRGIHALSEQQLKRVWGQVLGGSRVVAGKTYQNTDLVRVGEMLEAERRFGTTRAAQLFQPTFSPGSEDRGWGPAARGDIKVPLRGGVIVDIDWLNTLIAGKHRPFLNLLSTSTTYSLGKTYWAYKDPRKGSFWSHLRVLFLGEDPKKSVAAKLAHFMGFGDDPESVAVKLADLMSLGPFGFTSISFKSILHPELITAAKNALNEVRRAHPERDPANIPPAGKAPPAKATSPKLKLFRRAGPPPAYKPKFTWRNPSLFRLGPLPVSTGPKQKLPKVSVPPPAYKPKFTWRNPSLFRPGPRPVSIGPKRKPSKAQIQAAIDRLTITRTKPKFPHPGAAGAAGTTGPKWKRRKVSEPVRPGPLKSKGFKNPVRRDVGRTGKLGLSRGRLFVEHRIRYGDRVWNLAKPYGSSNPRRFTNAVADLNPGIKFRRLFPGQIIRVPVSTQTGGRAGALPAYMKGLVRG